MTRLIWSNDEPSGLRSPTDETRSRARRKGSSRLGRSALRAGELAPRFRLPDQHGHTVMLSALLSKGPVVLRFCRHDGTSSYLRELDTLIAVHIEIERWGATLAVIASEPSQPHPADKDPAAYAFEILIDKGAKVAKAYGLTYGSPLMGRSAAATADRDKGLQGRGEHGSALATYVIDRERAVAIAFVDLAGSSRMESDQIVMALECLSKRRRPKESAVLDVLHRADGREKP